MVTEAETQVHRVELLVHLKEVLVNHQLIRWLSEPGEN